MIWVVTLLFVLYFFTLFWLLLGFKKNGAFVLVSQKHKTHFSLIIPFRNEADNLPALLESLQQLDYPPELLELLFIDDASEDTSGLLLSAFLPLSRFSVKVIQNKRISNSPKKDAISEGIKSAQGQWIATTDADCQLPKNWLKTLDAFIQKNKPVMVCGPIIYTAGATLAEQFQQLDGLSLQLVTIGSFGLGRPLLCNGANLAYRKDAFEAVQGFSGNDHLASGDDIFLLEKLQKSFPGQVKFIKSKEAIVTTKTLKTWKSLINQRIRWASKTSKVKNPGTLSLGILVLLVNSSFLALPVLTFLDAEHFIGYVLLMLLKIMTDYLMVQQAASFSGIGLVFWKFIKQAYLYSLLVPIVTLGSLRGRYQWKGRHFEKQ